LFRVFRLFKVFPNLYTMLRGLVYSTEEQDEWCAVAFSTVFNSVVYFFQTLVVGDNWGACAIPLYREFPWHFWVLAFGYVTVQLGVTNLILAVIVEASARSRDEDMQEKAKQKRRQEEESRTKLLEIVRAIDEDKNGSVTLEELLMSFDTNRNFQNMMATLNIKKKDLEHMFHLMDADKSGSLSYQEFIESIIKAEEQDIRIQLMIMKLEVAEVSWLLRTHFCPEMSGGRSAKQHAHMEPAAVIGARESQTDLHAMTEDNTIQASRPHKVSRITSNEARFPAPLQAPLPSVKFVEDASTHMGVVAALEEQLQMLGAVLSERLQALVKDAADEASALVSRAGKPVNQATFSCQARGLEVSPFTATIAASSWRRSVEDSDQLDTSPRGSTNWANGCPSHDGGKRLAQKWITQNLGYLEHL